MAASAGRGPVPARLPKRRDFLRVQAGRRCAMPGFVLQAAPCPASLAPPDHGPLDVAASDGTRLAVRVGFTVSRKVGNAVERNRVRRRLREVARQVIPDHARPDLDYVLVGRQAALKRHFAALCQDLVEALKRLRALRVATP